MFSPQPFFVGNFLIADSASVLTASVPIVVFLCDLVLVGVGGQVLSPHPAPPHGLSVEF